MLADFYASEPHYLDHLAPVWHALAAERRGLFIVTGKIAERTAAAGVENVLVMPSSGPRDKPLPRAVATELRRTVLATRTGPLVVAAFGDLATVRKAGRPVVLAEHGAGQSYGGDRRITRFPSFAGAADRTGVALLLVPGEHPAARNRAAHPEIPCVVTGCPKLDARHTAPPKPRDEIPTVALTWHWDSRLCPETRSAFHHYASVLPALAADPRFRLLGHAHPRGTATIRKAYGDAGIELVADLDEIFARADLLVADNTSALFEFASLDRPVVVANAPWYRRDVEHGLRFWSAATVGRQVDGPDELADAIADALVDGRALRSARHAAVRLVYGTTDGRASRRAADAIGAWMDAATAL